jgi:hypothetical protein
MAAADGNAEIENEQCEEEEHGSRAEWRSATQQKQKPTLKSYASQSSIARSFQSAVTSITFWLNNLTQQSPEDEDTTIWTEIPEKTPIRDSSALLLLTWSTSHVEPSSQSLPAWMSKVAQDVYEIFLRGDHHQWKRLSDLKKETHCSLHQLKKDNVEYELNNRWVIPYNPFYWKKIDTSTFNSELQSLESNTS